jgi:hypothetical protein
MMRGDWGALTVGRMDLSEKSNLRTFGKSSGKSLRLPTRVGKFLGLRLWDTLTDNDTSSADKQRKVLKLYFRLSSISSSVFPFVSGTVR